MRRANEPVVKVVKAQPKPAEALSSREPVSVQGVRRSVARKVAVVSGYDPLVKRTAHAKAKASAVAARTSPLKTSLPSASVAQDAQTEEQTTALAAEREAPEQTAPTTSEVDAETDRKDVAVAPSQPSTVQVASQEPIFDPEDEKAMIKDLKQRVKMQRRGDGLSVPLFDTRF
jgi:hypothetical protein